MPSYGFTYRFLIYSNFLVVFNLCKFMLIHVLIVVTYANKVYVRKYCVPFTVSF